MRRALGVASVDAVFLPALEALPLVGILVVLWYGAHRVLSGAVTLGTFTEFNVYLALLVAPLRTIGQRVATVQQAVASAERVVEVLRAEPVVVEVRRTARRSRRMRPSASSTFTSPTAGPPVLDGFTLEIPAGTHHWPSSARRAPASRPPPRCSPASTTRAPASIEIGGVDVRRSRSRSFAVVSDSSSRTPFCSATPCAATSASPLPTPQDEEVEWATRLAGAHEFVERLPSGYETRLGERGFSLSGGQRQRLAIARAILADPKVLILDDATSAVDATKEHEIRAALTEVLRGRTTLVIAHRPATIALADRGGARRERTRDRTGHAPRARRLVAALSAAARSPGSGGGLGGQADRVGAAGLAAASSAAAPDRGRRGLAMVGATSSSSHRRLLVKLAIDRGITRRDGHAVDVIALVYVVLVLAGRYSNG